MKVITGIISMLMLIFTSTAGDKSLIHSIPSKVDILNYKQAENLRIYPLTYSGTSKSFITLKEAIAKNIVIVKEKNSGEVNTVIIKNKGGYIVFAMAGEIIKGAKQDRMIENDLLLPPNSGWMEIDVYCTEHGRWHGESKQFAGAAINASPRIRNNARKEKNQSKVWEDVREQQEQIMSNNSETEAFADIYESISYLNKRDSYYEKLKNLPSKNLSIKGVLVCVGDDIICLDLFASHSIFKILWPKLLNSYIVEAINGNMKGSVSIKDAKKFLKEFKRIDLEDEYSPGKGDLYEIDSYNAQGSAILYKGKLIHTDLFPN